MFFRNDCLEMIVKKQSHDTHLVHIMWLFCVWFLGILHTRIIFWNKLCCEVMSSGIDENGYMVREYGWGFSLGVSSGLWEMFNDFGETIILYDSVDREMPDGFVHGVSCIAHGVIPFGFI